MALRFSPRHGSVPQVRVIPRAFHAVSRTFPETVCNMAFCEFINKAWPIELNAGTWRQFVCPQGRVDHGRKIRQIRRSKASPGVAARPPRRGPAGQIMVAATGTSPRYCSIRTPILASGGPQDAQNGGGDHTARRSLGTHSGTAPTIRPAFPALDAAYHAPLPIPAANGV